MDVFMRESDAFTWYMEGDPVLRSTVVIVAWLDKTPEWASLVAKVDRATRLIPQFRQRVLEPPARLAAPRWTTDGDFDLGWHLRRTEAPAPHTPQTVVEFARREAMTAFDRSRPLWEATLIEHLDGDKAALVMKLHHSLTDGIGAVQLALLLFDDERRPAGDGPMPSVPAGEEFDAVGLVRAGVAQRLQQVGEFVGGRARSALPSALRAARHPLSSSADVVRTAASIGRTVVPVLTTLSPVMQRRGLGRHLDHVDFSLDEFKRAAGAAGGSINDGFVAALAGGLRRYHERHDASVDRLRVTMPISLRTPQDPIGGNRITLMRLVVPVSQPDPALRIADIGRRCRAIKEERSLAFANTIAGALNLLPSAAVGSMLKHVDFLASDVPGFTAPVYLAGAKVERYVVFGPTIGASVNVTMLSYCGRCYAGINVDTAAVPDPDVLVECLREGFDEVLGLGGAHEPAARLPGPPPVPAEGEAGGTQPRRPARRSPRNQRLAG
jgi:WS/DGAT/MGAT family acyltransferase